MQRNSKWLLKVNLLKAPLKDSDTENAVALLVCNVLSSLQYVCRNGFTYRNL